MKSEERGLNFVAQNVGKFTVKLGLYDLCFRMIKKISRMNSGVVLKHQHYSSYTASKN